MTHLNALIYFLQQLKTMHLEGLITNIGSLCLVVSFNTEHSLNNSTTMCSRYSKHVYWLLANFEALVKHTEG